MPIIKLKQRDKDYAGQANLRFPPSSIQLKRQNTQPETFSYRNAAAVVSFSGRTVDIEAQMDVDEKGRVQAVGRIDLAADGNHQIAAHAVMQASASDTRWIERSVPALQGLEGGILVWM